MKDSIYVLKRLGKLLYAYVHGNNPLCSKKGERSICPKECGQKHRLDLDTAIAWEMSERLDVLFDLAASKVGFEDIEDFKKSLQETQDELYKVSSKLLSIVGQHGDTYPTLVHILSEVYDEVLDFDDTLLLKEGE